MKSLNKIYFYDLYNSDNDVKLLESTLPSVLYISIIQIHVSILKDE